MKVSFSKPKLDIKINLELTIEEAQALHAMSLYGDKDFLDFFYEKLGRTYLEPHEAGLKQLFTDCKKLEAAFKKIADLAAEWNKNSNE